MIVKVKYCGHCNPQLDGSKLIQEVGSIMPWARFVLYDDLHYKHVEYNLFLVVSGCPVGCGARSLPQVPSKIPFIRVAGNTINQWPVAKERLPEELSKLILELVSKRLS